MTYNVSSGTLSLYTTTTLRGHKCIITVTYTDTQDSVVVL